MRKFPIFLACLLLLMSLLTSAGMAAAPMATVAPMPGYTPTPLPPVADDTQADDLDMVDGDLADSQALIAPQTPDEDAEDAGVEMDGAMEMPQEADDAAQADQTPSVTPSPSPEPTAAPVANQDFDIAVELGYGGLVIMNRWTPTYVTVTNHGQNFDGFLGVNVFINQTEYDRYEMPLTLAQGATKRILLPIKPQTRQDMYAFELVKGDTIIAEQRTAPRRLVSPETITIALLAEDPQALAYMDQRANGIDTLRGEVWMTIPLTEENFPETADLMGGFSMLVVDGIDPRTLSEAQQQALTAWLVKGGVVFVSGGTQAAVDYPFFTQWTGFSGAGKPFEVEDITQTLLDYATIKGTPTEESIWLNPLEGSGVFLTAQEQGLLAKHAAGDGLIITAAFNISGKPLSNWISMPSIWPRILRQSSPTEYQSMLTKAEEHNQYYYNNSAYQANMLVSSMGVPNPQSGWPVVLLLVAYVVIVGFGGYIILKKLDKREWLWVSAPVSAIVFCLLLVLVSRSTSMNKPVALTASKMVLEGNSAQSTTYIGVAAAQSDEMLIQTGDQLPSILSADSYYGYDDPMAVDKLYRPLNQRQRYRLGDEPALGFRASEAWDTKMLELSGMQPEAGSIDSHVWMEKDGMHGEITNNTDYTFRHCITLTSFGYSDIGDLLPGQTAAFEMLYPSKPIDQTSPDFVYQPNIMYSTLDIDMTQTGYRYYDNGIYTYLSPAVYGTNDPYQSTNQESETYKAASQRYSLVQLFEQDWNFYENRSGFYFFGFNDSIGQVSVKINGQLITRQAHTAVVANRITFEPIGPTGEVMYPQGLIVPEVVIDQDDKKPLLPSEADTQDTNSNNPYGTMGNNTYLSLSGPVSLRFKLPNWGEYEITKMTLMGTTYETMPTMSLYNHEQKQWDEQKLLSVSLDGEKWAPYIDKDGSIYVRYVPADSATRYEGMNTPSISLKGEVKD